MNITIVCGSPKKRLSTSMYFSMILRFFLLGHKVTIVHLKSVRDYTKLLALLPDTEALVFAFPIYVDAIPSNLLDYLRKLQNDIFDKNYKLKVYSLTNCGFYEGKQCHVSLDMLKNWCSRAKVEWCGGIGIGGGEMLSILRLNIPIGIAISVIELIVHAVSLLSNGNFSFVSLFEGFFLRNLVIQIIVYAVFSLGLFVGLFRMKNSIVAKKVRPNIYTTVWFCPRFLFVWVASIFWVLRALVCHGVPVWNLFRKNPKVVGQAK